MPTFTTVALETLLEPRFRDSYKNNLKQQQQQHKEKLQQNPNPNARPRTGNHHIYISPALYTTPEQTPVTTDSSSADSVSPSPYVFNRKGRGGKVVNQRIDGFEVRREGSGEGERKSEGGGEGSGGGLEGEGEEEEVVVDDGVLGTEVVEEREEDSVVVDDGFFELQGESASVGSSGEMNDFGKQVENLSCVSNQGEFFDANDDFSSDGSFSNGTSRGQTIQSLESEMRATRLSLLEEIERRRAAEEALGLMQSQWQRVSNLLSQAGLTFPTPLDATRGMEFDINAIEQLSQEVVVARFVADAIGKGQARAEAELARALGDSSNMNIGSA